MNKITSTIVNISRLIVGGLATLGSIVTFALMVITNDTYANWLQIELMLLCGFILSMILAAVADDPNRLLRHLFAITVCVLAFSYRRLKIKHSCTAYCNTLRRKLDGYPRTYRYSLANYDNNLHIDFDRL